MNGDTPIDIFALQFTQRDASSVSGVPMTTINNWILRKAFTFGTGNERPDRRRMFSIADVARLHVMRFCTEHLELSPEAAAFAAGGVNQYFGGGISPVRTPEGERFDVWHWAHKRPEALGAPPTWTIQGVWMKPSTGAFFQYHPGVFGDDEPCGPPHFPCIAVPTSTLANRMFLFCADLLMEERGHAPGTSSQGLPDLPETFPTNVERQSAITEPGHDAPASLKE